MNDVAHREWTLRPAVPGDLGSIRQLYQSTWGYNRPLGFDRWRYLTPPDGFCPIVLADTGTRLAGAYILWPVRIRVADQVVLGAQSMDTMTHPDFQGQGIFTKLAEACFDLARRNGISLLYGFPNPLSYPVFTRRLAFPHVGDVMHWIRPVRPSRHPRVPGVLGPALDAAMLLWPSGRRSRFEMVAGRPPDASLMPLLDQWNEHGGCCIERTATWLDWRYAAEAENDYRWIGAYRGGVLAAAAVWGMRTPPWGAVADGRAHLVELLGHDEAALASALNRVLAEVRAAGAMLIETVANDARVCRALARAGFLRHRRAPLIVKALDDRLFGAESLSGANWRIMGGDVDTF